ncbi:ornithine carbamoyltransferase [Campylobacter rectus]|uniref:ornithine carbamoyltransferase n=1 Tax=Campylobacter rectus TaxID=203 RepID=UPI000F5F286C|nr:ornithine carbamoyltransferase [Campylobacter rectus]RRD54650.1 ornithine carbamoyltransferase [Campylobacter rectus]
MKISFECDCVLLEESLKLFLRDFISPRKDCDFIVADRKIETKKPVFVIAEHSPHLQIPFSKEVLISALEEFYSAIQFSEPAAPSHTSAFAFAAAVQQNGSNLELEVSNLIDKFKEELLALLRKAR